VAIPTSVATQEQAQGLGIPLVTLATHSKLDVAIDGADEVDPALNLVKGRGGALLREKMVEACAAQFICIVDESKLVRAVGASGGAFPVEIVPFCWEHTVRRVAAAACLGGCGAVALLRRGGVKPAPDLAAATELAAVAAAAAAAAGAGAAGAGAGAGAGDGVVLPKPFVTDNGNFIVDLFLASPLADAAAAAAELLDIVGVVEHGLFLGMATACLVAGKDGVTVKHASKSAL
jgi:ribose 5-phosphate isomerase A